MEVRANLATYRGHGLPVWDVAACPQSAPFYFASAGADRTARMWSTDRVQPLRLFVGQPPFFQSIPSALAGCVY